MRYLVLLMLCCLTFQAHAASLENRNAADADHAPVFAEHDPFITTVTVRNPHDRAVRVERVDASCTCVDQRLADRFFLPHATTTLSVTIANTNRSGPQRMAVTIYLTDPELEPIEVELLWNVTPDVAVDAIAALTEPTGRPGDIAWRDIYRFTAHERPDELHRLNKRIRLESPRENAPVGGLEILGIDYTGPVWAFTPLKQADGSWLITASAKSVDTALEAKTYDERMIVRTNHPHKSAITLEFVTVLGMSAGREAIDPMLPPP